MKSDDAVLAEDARDDNTTSAILPPSLQRWLRTTGKTPFDFQHTVWQHIADGNSGLLHATTGAGKTLAVWLGAVAAFGGSGNTAVLAARLGAAQKTPPAPPLTILWITPMRALAADTTRALAEPLNAIDSRWRVELRTGDTPAAQRARQDRRLPTALVTTPESLSLLLSRANAADLFSAIRMIVVDEWHELLGNKRGVQVQLAIARLVRWQPALQLWGLSATLGDVQLAHDALLRSILTPTYLVEGKQAKQRIVDTLLPPSIDRFPWAGHLGTRLAPAVAAEIDHCASALVFTNTRSQAEIWYQALLECRPDWAGIIALHHGSLDHSVRDWVENALKSGKLRAVVCTSSLDLGVDFAPVDRVFQVGSPKGIARLLQRAGRSGHSPGRASRITIVPTHALELVEAAAARHAVQRGQIEARYPPEVPLDVLVQHLVTIALGGGFPAAEGAAELLDEIRQSWSFRTLRDDQFAWALSFVENGGTSLTAYPDYHRIARDERDIYRVPRADLARRHRANIGTIVADAAMRIEWLSGGRIGTIEESFMSRLKPGDIFTFAGRTVELVRVREMTAYVKRATSARGAIPQWQGGRMPLSSELADAIIALLGDWHAAAHDDPEMHALTPLLDLQQRWSHVPAPGMLLIETLRTREGHHFFCYPFAGRTAHLGLASLLAWRAANHAPATLSLSMNDYGFELLSATPIDWPTLIDAGLFDVSNLENDILASLNASELATRRFREIARIAGLIFQSRPGEGKTARQLQASAGLFYEVFQKHDPDNRLLTQARAEVLFQELDFDRLRKALHRIATSRVVIVNPPKPTPFAFPLMIGRLRERISTEKLADRIARMLTELERAAGPLSTAGNTR